MVRNVAAEVVQSFNNGANVSGSYLQDARHGNVTERFKVIQPAAIGNAMSEQGFNLVSLLTGKGRHDDKKDFQRTIARYRSDTPFEIEGLSLDIIYISKHLGRGCDELRLGLYRGICANQWAVGTLFEMIRFRHTGNPLDDIQEGIAAVLAQRGKLIDKIKAMQGRTLSISEIEALAKRYADIRLEGKENVIKADFRSLAAIHREADTKVDLFTVANVLQENVIRFPMKYTANALDANGVPYERNMTTRKLRESSSRLVDLNGKMFDAAMELVA